MNAEKRRNPLNSIWMGLGFLSYAVSLLFENAGMVSFVLAIVGLIVLVLAIIYEIVGYKTNKRT